MMHPLSCPSAPQRNTESSSKGMIVSSRKETSVSGQSVKSYGGTGSAPFSIRLASSWMSKDIAATVVYPKISGDVGHGETRDEKLVITGLEGMLRTVGGDVDGETGLVAGANVEFPADGTIGTPTGNEVEFSPIEGSVEITIGVPIGAMLEGITGLMEGITPVTGTKVIFIEIGATGLPTGPVVPLVIGANTGTPVDVLEFVVEGALGLATGANVSLAVEGATGTADVKLVSEGLAIGLKAGENVSLSMDGLLVGNKLVLPMIGAVGLPTGAKVSLPKEGITGAPPVGEVSLPAEGIVGLPTGANVSLAIEGAMGEFSGKEVLLSLEGAVGTLTGKEVIFALEGAMGTLTGKEVILSLEGTVGTLTGKEVILSLEGAVGTLTGKEVIFAFEGAMGTLTGKEVILSLEGTVGTLTGKEVIIVVEGAMGTLTGKEVKFSLEGAMGALTGKEVIFTLEGAMGLVSFPMKGIVGLSTTVEFTNVGATGLVVCDKVLFVGAKLSFTNMAAGAITDGVVVTTVPSAGELGEIVTVACLDESIASYSAPQVLAVANSMHVPVQVSPW
jgi:hypothetical protein